MTGDGGGTSRAVEATGGTPGGDGAARGSAGGTGGDADRQGSDGAGRSTGRGGARGVEEYGDEGGDPIALRLEALILGAERRYTPFQAARAAGVSMDLASRFWRAMGFADIGQARALTEADVLALRRLAGLVEAGLLSEPMAIQVARSTGQTTARLADWQIDSFLEGLTEPQEPGMTRTEITYPLVELLLPELEEFLIYVWRRQLAASTGRVVQAQDDAEMVDRRLAVGFADLVGFTRLTRRLEEEELGELVEAFETTAADLVAAHGGRLIKTLGDEVLYSADDAGTAAEIGLRLIETMTHDETMPELRVGLAFGTVTTRMGDVFGTTVNLASRLTSIAPKDAVLVDGAFAEELARSGDAPKSEVEAAAAADGTEKYRFALQPMWQRPVRGLGVVEPWLLTRRNGG
ncbi:adenylate/guanylate cyclase domain-containing protein [Streptomyces albireticuli]|uniref:Adenylate/guanylate cyclase domain-containing protein n=1 Tax=Streptomyces albireticuli TaxID=1940 RepID=A0A2A2D9R7_9ACTN|nr:adenylate/guanylate cyclase domain-containing protein [Streptomyces albireticuli]MCD9142715.1 adenylate/guanylate cyclase domain-containing protein [Streptomyces albireticuli]MCD9162966.1 adenylate/guanylate cyclase domain-containing protein [Streptomyces albireticuli]MCD9192843.1 adenylate/guanylate cyclase domain-containing protein [Streptomyces albireticuli]PAU48110.1 adenylate/guanylate cyclase domain-containing protein [Streptomyces albireticuli]